MNPISRKIRFLLVPVIVLLAGRTTPAVAQSALDGFDPNANGTIQIVVLQSDGKILIGGAFTSLAPNGGVSVTRNHIARLNPDGSLDTAFDPNANGTVFAIVLQADGKILVGGDFNGANSIGGQARNFIARLDATTGAADSFDPSGDDSVLTIAVQADGKILAGGLFNGIGGQPRLGIARLDPSSGLADSFDPHAAGEVDTIAAQRDGKILAGGLFNEIGGQTRHRIARLDPVTGLADSFNPNANGQVSALFVQADGKILVSGSFQSIGGQMRNRIARLDASTALADSFNPNASAAVTSIAIQADGKVLAGGAFINIGGQMRSNIARLNATSGLADSFDPKAGNTVQSIAVQPDGKILAGGFFTTVAPNGGAAVTRNRIARLEIDGRLDQTLNPNVTGNAGSGVYATAVQLDGKILIGGYFDEVLGVLRRKIARLNADGTLDTAFNPNANDIVISIAVQADGKILVGGVFSSIGGQTRNGIARLDPTTGLADSFNPNANGFVNPIVVQPDGKILVGGFFTGIGGQVRNRIARLDAISGLADSFNPNANGIVRSISVQADDKILASGSFTNIGGQPRNHIARLDAASGLADSFNPNANHDVASIAVQADGKILVGGSFNGANSIGGQMRNRMARLDPTTGLADSFDPNANVDVLSIAMQADGKILPGGQFTSIGGQVRNYIARLDPTTGLADSFDADPSGGQFPGILSVTVQADGKILAGGTFTNIGGQPRSLFARLTNGTAALQNLAATQTTIAWIRGGSSPQFARVTFESSTDNMSYNFLGNGVAAGSDWTLTGLNLPTGQNLYIRARGYHRSGDLNGSESITESVRNVFIRVPPTPTQVVSRKLHGGTPFDVVLPLTGTAGIECRTGGESRNHQVVAAFGAPVTFTFAAVTSGAGSVTTATGNGTPVVTVNLTGVTNAQRIIVTVFGLSDGTNTGELGIPMGVLLGDTSGNGTVNASDVIQTKSKAGQAVDATDFRTDVTVSNSINASDVGIVKSKVGTALP